MKCKSAIELPDFIDAAGRRVLLHSCCAPCSSAILEFLLQHDVAPTVFYSNSNIFPLSEYEHRCNEIRHYLHDLSIPFVEDVYDHQEWLDYVRGLENQPERGARCLRCFEFRLKRAAEYAKEHGFDFFTTTLSISPHTNAEVLNEVCCEASEKYGIPNLWADFKKRGGYKRSCELSEIYGIYRQNYCGCRFSLRSTEK